MMGPVHRTRAFKWVVAVGLCLVAALPAQASMWGEENLTLGAILTENIKQVFSLEETIARLREMTALARDSAAFARESMQVSKNLHAIATHPADFAEHATRGWNAAFPELGDIVANVEQARLSADAVAHPGSLDAYDPYVYVRFIDRVRFLQGSSFEVLAHGADPWDINGRYDAMLQTLEDQHTVAQDLLANAVDLVNGSGLSPVQASVSTAQTSAVSATAQVQAAATLQRIARTQEWQVMQHMYSHQKAGQLLRREFENAYQNGPVWVLDPLGTRPVSRRGAR